MTGNIFSSPLPGAASAELVQAALQVGLQAHRAGQLAQAQRHYLDVLQLAPGHFDALRNLGLLAGQVGAWSHARDFFERALSVQPRHAALLSDLGLALLECEQLDDARLRCQQAVQEDPQQAVAHLNLGNVLLAQQRQPEAIASYDRAIALNPGYLKAHLNRGNALRDLRQLPAAEAAYRSCLAVQAAYPLAHLNLGSVLIELGRNAEALQALDAALSLDAGLADAHFNRAVALIELKQHALALAALQRVRELRPDHEFLAGMLDYAQRRLCRWEGLAELAAEIRDGVHAGRRVVQPFVLLLGQDDPVLQRDAARVFAQARVRPPAVAPSFGAAGGPRRLRIGYFSSDFRQHPVSLLLAELFERHNRQRFEVFAFSLSTAPGDAMTARLRGAFDHYIDAGALADGDVAALARERGLDIAVDLGGYTAKARPGVMAHRAAPVQVGYAGFLGGRGAAFMDYLVADRFLVPGEARAAYDEALVYLPCYQAVDTTQPAVQPRFSRAALGLPEEAVVYCCFNNAFKITAETFALWMQILRQVPQGVLWLMQEGDEVAQRLRAAAEGHGVAPQRLVFAPRMPREDHLARYLVADVFLDTLPCNAGATAVDALWAGLPVLTRAGRAFAGRLAGSILSVAGLHDLIAPDDATYVRLAVELGHDPGRRQALRQHVAQRLAASRLFDTGAFVADLERAFEALHHRHVQGLPPQDLDLAAGP